MKKIVHKSAVPIYITAAIWVIACIILPLYKPSHFIILFVLALAAYFISSKLIPDDVEYVEVPEEPVNTGNEEIDQLLKDGETAVSEMQRLKASINNAAVKDRIDKLISVTDSIFKDLLDDPSDLPQVKRFSSYFLPTTIKMLNAYDRLDSQGISGENISGSMNRIEDILDKTIEAYQKQLDCLFKNQALDIETDITVLEAMLKKEGLSGSDFDHQ